MLNRRTLIAAAAALAVSAGAAAAQDWKAKYPELVFAIIPAENASGVTERFTPLTDYLTKQLGTKVTLRIANDYAAVIEGQRAGNIHIASYGPSSFARALMTGAKIEAFAIEVNADGTKGYHSVLYVKADSPYKSIEDLKGKNLCLVDPNSTSGNNVPRFSLNKMGIKPDEFFGKVVYAGSHENAVIAVQQGTCDAAFNWWNDEQESNLKRMERKGMAKYDDYRIIFKSDQIVNSPYAYLADMPAELKAKIRDAFFSIDKNDKAAFDKIYEGKQQMWQPVDNESYVSIIELNKFVDELRKKKS
ncbi:phosphonate ABC transporter substrate-binding protein [Xanthobacter autotrophicus]|jgi:phosphonate transport system substrate-binding protein|uniref:Phosphonate ABC transporter substrate-binding protein n=1 Tax=Xanthobacter autotrophicus TaxID=280 RepID=A0A6C1KKG8_XANAU|nr:phosphonate ABC transporter substrate-binding protein [Xanthobacter autotrophicus]TLX44740.1 phosphonate ABC transporter substrate-binding protein [Xanthobacter autotrophicus]